MRILGFVRRAAVAWAAVPAPAVRKAKIAKADAEEAQVLAER